ncbi:hypothetical protein [Bacillus sp. UNCCL81]|uniref:hypothetical protein n=1 Tax=Bacillus sp. UNCCL81 TaxID=1502755 RepID=UPI0008F3208C|nr:hypothetical protein [Bacillus sp. UNCCL81]SFC95255.1 hypothetical protein SAMN02799633_02119 [Bacillus sp. UNCCL81]
MSVSSKFYHFSYTPKKLVDERIRIENKFEEIDKEIPTVSGKVKLPDLLEEIRKTKLKEIESILSSFSKLDIRILMYEYPFSNEKHEDQIKINHILTALYRSEFGKIIWKLFQEDFSNEYLNSLLKSSYSKEREKFVGMSEKESLSFGEALENKTGIVNGLIDLALNSNDKLSKVFGQWKVVKESSLERKLIEGVLLKGVKSNKIFEAEKMKQIIEYLNKMPLNVYQNILKNYIEVREYKKFDDEILKNAINRLLNPKDDDKLWNFLEDTSMNKVKKWINQAKLKEVFEQDKDNKRFEYWKRFNDFFEDVEVIRDPLVAFMYFKDFVVVEFGIMGAAYFYHKTGFDELIYPRINSFKFRNSRSNSTKENMLKETITEYQGIELYINKLTHLPVDTWPVKKFDPQMSIYLNELPK